MSDKVGNSGANFNKPKHQSALTRARLAAKSATLERDGLMRGHYKLPREQAREIAREWLDSFPKAAYWTRVEAWRVLPDDTIEFTMVRLPSAD